MKDTALLTKYNISQKFRWISTSTKNVVHMLSHIQSIIDEDSLKFYIRSRLMYNLCKK